MTESSTDWRCYRCCALLAGEGGHPHPDWIGYVEPTSPDARCDECRAPPPEDVRLRLAIQAHTRLLLALSGDSAPDAKLRTPPSDDHLWTSVDAGGATVCLGASREANEEEALTRTGAPADEGALCEERVGDPTKDSRLHIAEVEDLTGWNRSTIARRYRKGKFPRPHRLADCKDRVWRLSEIRAWLAENVHGTPRSPPRGAQG
jgi:predicted DNA-binding transcriptional regulator AlpA